MKNVQEKHENKEKCDKNDKNEIEKGKNENENENVNENENEDKDENILQNEKSIFEKRNYFELNKYEKEEKDDCNLEIKNYKIKEMKKTTFMTENNAIKINNEKDKTEYYSFFASKFIKNDEIKKPPNRFTKNENNNREKFLNEYESENENENGNENKIEEEKEKDHFMAKFVSFPILVFPLFILLIILEFVGIFSITAIFSVSAISLTIFTILFNYYKNYPKYKNQKILL